MGQLFYFRYAYYGRYRIIYRSTHFIYIFFNRASSQLAKNPISIAIEMLAAIPSIIYGMWGCLFRSIISEHIQPVV